MYTLAYPSVEIEGGREKERERERERGRHSTMSCDYGELTFEPICCIPYGTGVAIYGALAGI